MVRRTTAGSATDWRAVRGEAKRAGDMAALERAMSGQMTHDLAVTAHENLDASACCSSVDESANDLGAQPRLAGSEHEPAQGHGQHAALRLMLEDVDNLQNQRRGGDAVADESA